jgi:hypothetical protein
LLEVDGFRRGNGLFVRAGRGEQVVVSLDGRRIHAGLLERRGVVVEQTRVGVERDTIDAAADGVDDDLLGRNVVHVGGEYIAQVPERVGQAGDFRVVEEDAIRHIGAGDEGVLQLRIDIDRLMVHGDVGVDLIEILDGIVEDLVEVSRAIPNGDLALRGFLGRGREAIGRCGIAPSRDVGAAPGSAERDAGGQADGEDALCRLAGTAGFM